MRVVEGMIFLSLATGLHLGAWAVAPQRPGASSDGGTGAHEISLAAAAPQMAVLARSWRAPSETGELPDVMRAPRSEPAPPDTAAISPAPVTLPPVAGLAPVSPAALPKAPSPPAPRSVPRIATPEPPRPPTAPEDATEAPDPTADPKPRRQSRSAPTPPAPEKAARADRTPPAPPKPPQPAAKATPAQNAAGSSKTQAQSSGTAGHSTAQTANGGTSLSLKAEWGARIQRKVRRRLVYPRDATGSGVTKVSITVDRAGALTAMRVTRSSGVAAFDDAVLKAIRRSGRFPPAPDELGGASHSFTMSWTFSK